MCECCEPGPGLIRTAGPPARLTRRGLLAGIAGAAVASAAPAFAAGSQTRTLRLFRYHSGETLTATYFKDGAYQGRAVQKINAVCRDLLHDRKTVMDLHLLDYLHAVSQACDPDAVIEIISAYRTPETNGYLRSKSTNVAKKSKHMEGRAIDIRIRSVAPQKLAETAIGLKRGGVGLYEASGFVHLDTGSPRAWVITPEETKTARTVTLTPRPRPVTELPTEPSAAPTRIVGARPSLRPL